MAGWHCITRMGALHRLHHSTATGGVNTGGGNAGDGTVGFFDTSQANNRLYVYKLFSIDPSTTATYDSITVENAGTLTIGGGSALAVTNTVTVTGNSTILPQGRMKAPK